MKLFVGILVTLDVANSMASMACIYQLLVDGWGNTATLELWAGWPAGMVDLTLAPIGSLVQIFFARRVHIISGQRWITFAIVFFAMISFCAGIGTGIAIMWVREFSQFGKIKAIATVWAISPVVADFIITVVMTYYLQRSKGEFAATNRLLDRIIQLTVQNCALTSACGIVSISLYYAFDKPYYFGETSLRTWAAPISANGLLVTLFLLPKFCLHSALSSLNSRKNLRSLANATERSLLESRVSGSDQPQRLEPLDFLPMNCTRNSNSN
ncbi:hypothetical protein FIBSPDRAFT_926898 [Athelia psychrophila]|uniref:DUF6534 domain-containing protein n=1 Tax=Athelia psychrophila TaxID=1759441 RepID=A0A166SS50_9AGAM|nr:hypothetical protein FIBSPDRAFT_926898 [Fibularhizoctonia sp. CBS 109695]